MARVTRMARVTPAGNPAGRFSPEQYTALDRVFAAAFDAAASLPSDQVEIPNIPGKMSRSDALVLALGELDLYVQSNSLVAGDFTASKLSKKFHAIASAADKLLRTLEITEDAGLLSLPEQIRYGFKYFAEKEAEEFGGFSNHPPEIRRTVVDDEEVCYKVFHPERQLQQNIEGISQLLRWARQAEKENKLASKRTGKGSEEAARAMEELAYSNMQVRPEVNIYYYICDIWVGVLDRPLSTSVRQRKAAGPLIEFTTACLELVGVRPPKKKNLGRCDKLTRDRCRRPATRVRGDHQWRDRCRRSRDR